MTPPKRFQKKESPFKVTDLWAEVQKLAVAVSNVAELLCLLSYCASEAGMIWVCNK